MKYILITCSLLAVTLSQTSAQVPQREFPNLIASFSNSVQRGNTAGQIDALMQLNDKMNTQMTWLKSNINELQ